MRYGTRSVFERLGCSFPKGRISVVLGGSGAGKSTILRLIGGLSRPRSGRILVDGDEISRLRERRLYEVRRKIGMMFQGGALLDSMSVFDNVAFPLREHTRLAESEIAERVHHRLADVGLSEVDSLLPGELSGGMTKRVALARSLIQEPTIVLADEPFSGLDPMTTKLIEALLVRINEHLGVTMIVVSHHIPTTMRMAAWVVLLTPDGVVEGSPSDLMASRNDYVRRFLDESTSENEEALAHPEHFESRHRPGLGIR